MRQKCNKLEAKIVKLETKQNSLAQYGRRNNTVISGIPDSIDDNNLENTAISMVSNINVNIEENDIKLCHRFGKPDATSKSKKTIVLLTGKISIKFLKIKRNLMKIIMESITSEREQKFLWVKAWHQWMSPLPSTVGSWSVRNSFILVIAEMEL